jgi:CDP-diacylglycerol--glycerol-3-phosphate 3-phosphatidyltransferase
MNNKNLNISNIISFSRILFTIPISIAIWYDYSITAFILCLIGGALTDNLDGYFARKLNQVTEFGKIIDPVADKIFIGAIALVLLLKGILPLWFVLVIVGRDLLIMLAGLFLAKRIKFVVPSNVIGKATVTVLGLNLAFFILGWNEFANYVIYLSTLMILISSAVYTKNMLNLLKNA